MSSTPDKKQGKAPWWLWLVMPLVGIIALYIAGSCWGGLAVVNSLCRADMVLFAVIGVAYFFLRRKTPQATLDQVNHNLEDIRKGYREQRDQLVKAYKAEAKPIKDAFRADPQQAQRRQRYQARLDALRPHYVEKERPILDACLDSERQYLVQARKEHAITPSRFPLKLWRALLILPLALAAVLFFYGWGATSYGKAEADTGQTIGWTAEKLHMVHLDDETQYVCDPDGLLSAEALQQMNDKLYAMDRLHGIESVVVVVNHIANDDPFRLTQDIFERYGVGRDDRGLVIAIGWQDHNAFIATGSNLEGDLTDVECDELQTYYFDAYARAGQLDEAMTSLVNALYATFAHKELPPIVSDNDIPDTDEDTFWTLIFFLGAICVVWLFCMMAMWVLSEDRVKGLHAKGLLEGPWHHDTVATSTMLGATAGAIASDLRRYRSSGPSRSWGGGGFGGGRSSRGGSFGGGRSSGGGAGHRW